MFPDRPYPEIREYLTAYANEVRAALASVDPEQLSHAWRCLEGAADRRASIFVCGNGGSAAISNHFACDHVKGIGRESDIRPRVFSLCSNMAIFSAVANDTSYSNVFEYQLSALASAGDVVVAISSSGASPNVISALQWARANDLTSIAMTGFSGGGARGAADIALHVDSDNYGVVEDVHQSLAHILAQFLRQRRLCDPSLIGRINF